MAWDEWEQLKAQAVERQSARMQLNGAESKSGSSADGKYGDLTVDQTDLANIGKKAFDLHHDLWDKGRKAVPSSEKAAGALSKDGFALGGGLQHVATRWDEQLSSLRAACAHISNHLTATKNLHSEGEHYIRGKIISIAALDAGFDERVGAPGKHNPVYGDSGDKKDKN